MSLAQPAWLLLLPLPLLVAWLWPARREERPGLVVPFLDRLARDTGQRPDSGASVPRRPVWGALTLGVCWTCAVLATARPQVLEPPVTRQVPVRDLLLAVDLSGSMDTRDFQDAEGHAVDRLTAVKGVLDDFLAGREGDRVGLILFGSAPFVQVPFTQDLDVCRELLDEAQVRMAGPRTAFGDALGLAIHLFEDSTTRDRVLIALTDGNDTASQVPPVQAARIARDEGIVVHTVAVGDPQAAGEEALDVEALRGVAEATGGLFSHATDRDELARVYARLDELEPHEAERVSHRPRRDVFWWFLAAALGLSMLHLGAGAVRERLRTPTAPSGPPPTRVGVPGAAPLVGASRAERSAPAVPSRTSPAAWPLLPLAWVAPLGDLHLLRPAGLLFLLPALALWALLRRGADGSRPWRGLVAPHLLPHLLGDRERAARFGPRELVALAWVVGAVAVAGPTWRRGPSPFADDTAALAVVVHVSPSMTTQDVPPSRLERATQKLHDLLALRGRARTSLVAYAGSAHAVLPATSDAGVVDTFAGALSPELMPRPGDVAAEALARAERTLEEAGGGSILWITDGVAPEQAEALARWRAGSRTEVRLWPPLPAGAELDRLRDAAAPARADLVRLAADDSDVEALARAARHAAVKAEGDGSHWEEAGLWLCPLLLGLLLPLFRRGGRVPRGGAA